MRQVLTIDDVRGQAPQQAVVLGPEGPDMGAMARQGRLGIGRDESVELEWGGYGDVRVEDRDAKCMELAGDDNALQQILRREVGADGQDELWDIKDANVALARWDPTRLDWHLGSRVVVCWKVPEGSGKIWTIRGV